MPSGKQIAACFAAAVMGAGLATIGGRQFEKQKWRSAVSALVKPEMVRQFSEDTRIQLDGRQYGREAFPPASMADNCVIDSFSDAVADFISSDPAGLVARAAQELNAHNEEAAMRRTASELDRNFEAKAGACLAQAKTPAERERADAIKNDIGKRLQDYTR